MTRGPVIVEGFAGPGGWSEGLRVAAPDAVTIGVEIDRWACATARAAGRARIQADVARFPVAHLALQSFRPDYPVQGPRSARFLQVGNAVPPVLAAAVVGALVEKDQP